ncbi:MAG: hypothetical protein EBS38_07255 [Actinobacteria bacterium]|nr:hypothetical protein [Actinomycetota bacterium]
MNRFKSIGILLLGVTWILANTAWLNIGSEPLTGTELSQLFNLLPAISLLLVFIASYRKFERALLLIAALVMLGLAVLATTLRFDQTAAATAIYESLSGIQGATALDVDVSTGVTLLPWVAALTAVLASVALVVASLRQSEKVRTKRQEVDDNRALWDEQGN